MENLIFQIEKDLVKYPVFSQCCFSLEEKGLFVYCPKKPSEIYSYRYIILDCAMKLGISGFVIFCTGGERFGGVRITPENFIALKKFALEKLYRAT